MCSEPCQTDGDKNTKFVPKIVPSFLLLTIFGKNSILHVWQVSEYASEILIGNIFCSAHLCNDVLHIFPLTSLLSKHCKIFFFVFMVLFPHLVKLCCGFCTSILVTQLFAGPLEFSGALRYRMVDANFVYPVLGEKNSVTLYGYYFIRMVDISDTSLITLKRISKEIAMELLFACLSFWPLLMISSLLALSRF